MKRKVFIRYLRGEIDLKTFLDIVKEDPSLSLVLKGVVPQEALQDENNAYWKKRDYDTLFRALQNGKESKRQIPETVEGDAAQGMKTIEEFLMGEIPVEVFVKRLEMDRSVVQALEQLIPEDAKENREHPFWKQISFDVFKDVGSTAIGLLHRLARFSGTIDDAYNIHSAVSCLYIGSHGEDIPITTKYKDAFHLEIDAIPECYTGHEVQGVLNSIIDEAMKLTGKGKRIAYVKTQLGQLFTSIDRKRPTWIQGGEWPMGELRPMQYISRKRHGESVDYLFKDMDTGEIRTVTQYY